MGRIAIGDVHGCARTLQALLSRLALRPDDELIFVGDYIDRGPDAKGVVDTLLDDYTPDWQDRLAGAADAFNGALAGTSVAREDGTFSEYWTRYGQWARTNSDQADKIRIRHEFFVERMLGFLFPLTRKDPRRAFSPTEREIVYYRDRKRCAVCNGLVSWDDAEIHHVHEHARGGGTSLENGVLVHRECHPKGGTALAFAQQRDDSERLPVPDRQPPRDAS